VLDLLPTDHQCHLRLERQLTDVIEKNRSFVRALVVTDSLSTG